MRERKFNIWELQKEREEWCSVCYEKFESEKRERFLNRKQAVDMYIDGELSEDIERKTGIKRQSIIRFIKKCVSINPKTNRPFGYSALIGYVRTNKNENIVSQNNIVVGRGAFKSLLLMHPVLIRFIEDNYLGKTEITKEKVITKSNLHKKFLEECKKLNIQDYEYPFNTSDKAKRSLYSYLNKISEETPEYSIRRASKDAQQKFYSTGKEERLRNYPLIPFSTVQIDGHKIDAIYTVEVKDKNGEIINMPALRMWLIAVIDVSTRTILGYSLTPDENYNQTDILKALKNAMMPKQPIQFTLAGLEYPSNYGYPSLAIKETEWAMIDTIMLDNAKSHLAENVIYKICNTLHCSLNYGSVATPETRGIIERVFGTLEENGFHRLPTTTGSNIRDIRKENAEKNAIKYKVTYNDMEQLVEYFIALYNNAPHSSLNNESPLECMQRRINAGLCPHIASFSEKENINNLTNIIEYKTIRGSEKNGKRPYITYQGVEYRNDILSQSMGLIGEKLIIEVNPENIRTIKAYFENGTELGLLVATGEWGRKAHSLKSRKEAKKLANQNKKKSDPFYAPLTELENEFDRRALENRRERTKAAKLRNEQDRTLKSDSERGVAEIISMNDKKQNSQTTVQNNNSEKETENNKPYTIEQLEQIFKSQSLNNI